MNYSRWILVFGGCASVWLGCTHSPDISASLQKTPATPDYSRTPVLFVHGSGLNSTTWEPMMQHLVSIGYPPEYLDAVDLIPNDGKNERAARMFIAPKAESLLTRAGKAARSTGHERVPNKLDIVSHSMGAFSSRWYVAKLHPERVRTWIALAGANHGTNALCSFPSEGNNQMCPAFANSKRQSAIQVALNGTPAVPIDQTPYGLGMDSPGISRIPPDRTRSILYLTVRLDPDSWIKPESSAMIDGAGGIAIALPSEIPVQETSLGNYLFQALVEHDPLPQHPELIRLLTEMLTVQNEREVN